MGELTNEQFAGDELVVKLGKLEENITVLKNQRNEFNQLTKDSLGLRNEINEEIHQFLEKAKEFTVKRDDLNTQVKQLKLQRKELYEGLQINKKALEEIVEKEKLLEKGDIQKKRRSMSNLSSKIDKLEWNLQTSVLKPEEEREMIQILEKLSENLNRLAEEVHITTHQTELWRKISSSQKQINQLHSQIVDYAKESQIYHNLMNQQFQQVNALRKKANDYHKDFLKNKKKADNYHKDFLKDFLKNKKKADNYHKDFLSKVTEKNELKKQLKEAQNDHRKKIRERIKSNIQESVDKAFKKYENGENLSLEEFRLLVENGII
ncbi:MAG: coiled-coil protein [Candidatus Heimdallarchaeaceae archaeon]